MLGLGGLTTKLLIGAGIAMVIGLAFWHYTGLIDDKARLTADKATLQGAVAIAQANNGKLLAKFGEIDETIKASNQVMKDMAALSIAANETVRELNELFMEHDMELLARGKPGLMERRFTSGTNDRFRMLNQITNLDGPGDDGLSDNDGVGSAGGAGP